MLVLRKYICLALMAVVLCATPTLAKKPDSPALVSPQLLAILYQQSSAEYKALCLQTYNAATLAMKEHVTVGRYAKVGNRLCQPTVVTLAEGKKAIDNKPLAIVLDLDETVIDNSGFEAWCIINNKSFDNNTWTDWCTFQGEIAKAQRAVPGAVPFLLECQKMGITPIYITDRPESVRQGTLNTLKGLGLDTPDLNERLILRQKGDDEARALALANELGLKPTDPLYRRMMNNYSKKAGRRMEVSCQYNILAFFGDNLHDHDVFIDTQLKDSGKIRAARDAEVEVAHRLDWGTKFFLLPCPMYGSWVASEALPTEKVLEGLDDFGYGQWLAERKAKARAIPSNKAKEVAPGKK